MQTRAWLLPLMAIAACTDPSAGEVGSGSSETGESGSELTTGDTDPGDGDGELGDGDGDPGDGDGDPGDGDGAPLPPDLGDPFEPAPELPLLPAETLGALQADIDAALDSGGVAGTTQSVLIIDAQTGQELYARNPDTALKPASNIKLLTTAAAMEVLGEDHQMITEVRADAGPDQNGQLAGDLHLVLGHDVSWSSAYYLMPSDTVLDRIAQELAALGLVSVSGDLVVHGESLYNGQSLAYYDPASHRAAIASTFSSSLVQAGIAVAGATSTTPDFDQPGALLYAWSSPPLSVAAVPTNVASHNEFADIMLRHLGFELGGDSSYTSGGSQLIDWLASLPTSTADLEVYDGSGLSHDNRLSARTLVDTMRVMDTRPQGDAWLRSFAIAGVRGTLSNRMLGPDTNGRVWGKTGTLTGVISTSGVAYNRHDGRRYFVGMLMNEVPNAASARAVQDQVFEIVARDHWGTGRPATPTLRHVRAAASEVVEIAWTPVEGASGYLVWLSSDGAVWRREDARYVTTSEYRAGELELGPEIYVRVSALGPGGESDTSDVYGARSEPGLAEVLIVDGYDRWQSAPVPENPLARGHAFVASHGRAFADRVIWDTADNDAVLAGELALSDYGAVFWLTGEESTVDESFSTAEQLLVLDYLDDAGSLFVSGAEIGWDLVAQGSMEDAAFYAEALHADYISDDAESFIVDLDGGALAGIGPVGFYTPAAMVANYADQIAPREGAQTIASYHGGFGGTAAISYDADHQVVYLALPFAALDNADRRAALMAAVLDLFGYPEN